MRGSTPSTVLQVGCGTKRAGSGGRCVGEWVGGTGWRAHRGEGRHMEGKVERAHAGGAAERAVGMVCAPVWAGWGGLLCAAGAVQGEQHVFGRAAGIRKHPVLQGGQSLRRRGRLRRRCGMLRCRGGMLVCLNAWRAPQIEAQEGQHVCKATAGRGARANAKDS